jgi:hypothetical protein
VLNILLNRYLGPLFFYKLQDDGCRFDRSVPVSAFLTCFSNAPQLTFNHAYVAISSKYRKFSPRSSGTGKSVGDFLLPPPRKEKVGLHICIGLPDCIFHQKYQKSQVGFILEGLGMENVGIFYGHLVHFLVIWYIFPALVCRTTKNLATLVTQTLPR